MFNEAAQRQDLVDLLEARQASLWHACQLMDLRSYVALGGIPSRALLEQRHHQFTPFVTDASDRTHGVWDKVFFNLGDFGAAFARGSSATPNAYGPIALQVAPRALLAASEVAICLRSAGASDFDRGNEALETCGDVDRLFRRPVSSGFPASADIRWGEELQAEFSVDRPNARAPEISLELPSNLVPLEAVIAVWVDPIVVGESRLIDAVATHFAQAGVGLPVRPRWIGDDTRRPVFSDLARILVDGRTPLRLLAGRVDSTDATRAWSRSVLESDLEWLYNRFVAYLAEGTLQPLKESAHDGRLHADVAGLISQLEASDWRVAAVDRSSDPTLVASTDPLGEAMMFVMYRGRRRVARREVEAMIEVRRTRDLGWRRWALISEAGFSTDARVLAETARMETNTVDSLQTVLADQTAVPGRA